MIIRGLTDLIGGTPKRDKKGDKKGKANLEQNIQGATDTNPDVTNQLPISNKGRIEKGMVAAGSLEVLRQVGEGLQEEAAADRPQDDAGRLEAAEAAALLAQGAQAAQPSQKDVEATAKRENAERLAKETESKTKDREALGKKKKTSKEKGILVEQAQETFDPINLVLTTPVGPGILPAIVYKAVTKKKKRKVA